MKRYKSVISNEQHGLTLRSIRSYTHSSSNTENIIDINYTPEIILVRLYSI